MKDLRIVLIGAGSAQFGAATLGDIFSSKVLSGCTVVLHDIDAEALDRTRRAAERACSERGLDFRIEATCDRGEALRGADFCILSIEVGDRFELWEQDWKLPLQFGMRQVYGENGGPGGLFHTLRVVPPVLEICTEIEKFCPDALVLNYTNPMTRVCLAVARSHPGLRFVGLCHEVASLGRHLPAMLGCKLGQIGFRAAGLNHFSFLLDVRDASGRDLYPEVRKRAPEYFSSQRGDAARILGELGLQPPEQRPWEERWLFRRLLQMYGYLPITTDSHLGEYVGWAWRYADHEGIAEFFSAYKRYCREHEPRIVPEPSGERAVPIIEAVVDGTEMEEWAVNLPNNGLVDNLPANLVVEVPARVGPKGVEGIAMGRIPEGLCSLMHAQVGPIDLSVEAARRGSRELALQALLCDPVVEDPDSAVELLDTMLRLQGRYLGYLK